MFLTCRDDIITEMGTEKIRQIFRASLPVYLYVEKELQIGEYFIFLFGNKALAIVLVIGGSISYCYCTWEKRYLPAQKHGISDIIQLTGVISWDWCDEYFGEKYEPEKVPAVFERYTHRSLPATDKTSVAHTGW